MVYHLLAGPIEVSWINEIRPDAISLIPLYSQYDARLDVYNAMADSVLRSAQEGLRVAIVFYGHPMVGSTVSQLIREAAKRNDIPTRALPAISSVDCLFADIGFDPMVHGVMIADASQIIESASQFVLSSSMSLVLLQIGLTGIYDVPSFSEPLHPRLNELIEWLAQIYSIDHEATLYEASVHIAFQPRIRKCSIKDLGNQLYTLATTLFVPNRVVSAPG
jgi:hypothetical protein